MSREIIGYVQQMKSDGEWETVRLYNGDNKLVDLWYNGKWYDILNEYGYPATTTDLAALNEEAGYKNDESAPAWHAINLSNLLYLSLRPKAPSLTKEEYKEEKRMFESMVAKITSYVDFANEFYFSNDQIRFVFYLSY